MVTAATRFTTDSAASERRPTDPVSRQATVFMTMVTTAAAMESQANRASEGRVFVTEPVDIRPRHRTGLSRAGRRSRRTSRARRSISTVVSQPTQASVTEQP